MVPLGSLQVVPLVVCSGETKIRFDVSRLELFADQLQDWADVDGIIRSRSNSLDWDYIDRELQTLCELKEAPEIPERLRDLRRKGQR